MEIEFIKVLKIIEKTPHEVQPDNIDVADVKSFRNFKVDPSWTDYKGDCCQLSIKSATAKDGFYNIRIAETEESFGNRLGKVIPLNGKGANQ